MATQSQTDTQVLASEHSNILTESKMVQCSLNGTDLTTNPHIDDKDNVETSQASFPSLYPQPQSDTMSTHTMSSTETDSEIELQQAIKDAFSINIKDKMRNIKVNKIVHDRRGGNNNLWAMTDDLLIEVVIEKDLYAVYSSMDDEYEDMIKVSKYWKGVNMRNYQKQMQFLKNALPHIVCDEINNLSAE